LVTLSSHLTLEREASLNAGLLALVPAAAALGFAALGPVLFLGADESQTAPVFTNDPRTLNSFGKSTKQLIKRF